MALVELYRVTGERATWTSRRGWSMLAGTGILGKGRFGPAYWQDHGPCAEATSVAGHAVRQLYLDSGAVDVATELGDHDAARGRPSVAGRTWSRPART